ncbi:MAG: hypothetical protein ABL883_11650 [Terricaulis sp.]
MGVADDYASALLSVFQGPGRLSYREAERHTGILHAKIHAIANGKQSLALADLGETLAKFERLDPKGLAADVWLDLFVGEKRAQRERLRGGEVMIPLESLLAGLFKVIGFLMPRGGGGTMFIVAGAGATVTVGLPQIHQARLWEQEGVIADAVSEIVAAGGIDTNNRELFELPLDSAATTRLTNQAQAIALIRDEMGRISLIPAPTQTGNQPQTNGHHNQRSGSMTFQLENPKTWSRVLEIATGGGSIEEIWLMEATFKSSGSRVSPPRRHVLMDSGMSVPNSKRHQEFSITVPSIARWLDTAAEAFAENGASNVTIPTTSQWPKFNTILSAQPMAYPYRENAGKFFMACYISHSKDLVSNFQQAIRMEHGPLCELFAEEVR